MRVLRGGWAARTAVAADGDGDGGGAEMRRSGFWNALPLRAPSDYITFERL
uniref:Uncharacterized protein n=1 Tax=Arundo donax TaxID=35708 RepID=A0A0A9EME2_ARUDO